MNLCHLYNNTDSLHIEKILNSFDDSVSINFTDVDSIGDYGIYIVEIDNVTKELSEKIRSLLNTKVNPLIYFIIPQKYNLMLFQLAFVLNAKTIITLRQDTDKVITKLKSDFKYHNENHLEFILGKSLVKRQEFLFFRDNKLSFVTPQLLKDSKCNNLTDFEKTFFPQLDVDKLLDKENILVKSILNSEGEKDKVFIALGRKQ